MSAETQQKKPDLGLLEEDDEFEEFPAEGLLNLNVLYDINDVTDTNCTVIPDLCNLLITEGHVIRFSLFFNRCAFAYFKLDLTQNYCAGRRQLSMDYW